MLLLGVFFYYFFLGFQFFGKSHHPSRKQHQCQRALELLLSEMFSGIRKATLCFSTAINELRILQILNFCSFNIFLSQFFIFLFQLFNGNVLQVYYSFLKTIYGCNVSFNLASVLLLTSESFVMFYL